VSFYILHWYQIYTINLLVSYDIIIVFQQKQRMKFTFHNSYVIPGIASSTLLFCMDRAQLLRQNILKQGYVTPMLKSSLQNSTTAITIWLTVTKYPFLILQWMFPLLHRFFPLSPPILSLDLIILVTRRVSHTKRDLLTFRKYLGLPQVMYELWNINCIRGSSDW
jgi:hypothetical protein